METRILVVNAGRDRMVTTAAIMAAVADLTAGHIAIMESVPAVEKLSLDELLKEMPEPTTENDPPVKPPPPWSKQARFEQMHMKRQKQKLNRRKQR